MRRASSSSRFSQGCALTLALSRRERGASGARHCDRFHILAVRTATGRAGRCLGYSVETARTPPMMEHGLEILVSAAERLGVRLDAGQQALFRTYFEVLEQGAEFANLTGARGWERVREELFIRSLRLLTPAPGGYVSMAGWFDSAAGWGQGPTAGSRGASPADAAPPARRVIDVGTGAGIPGLVLKIAIPGMALTLLDSNQKKCDFLRRAVRVLGLSGVSVVQARAEAAAHDPAHREKYDLVLARAVARLAELAELTLPFAKVGGAVIVPKGAGIEDEVEEAAYAAEQMGAAPAITQTVSSPGSAPADTVLYWLKLSPTPPRYPRRVGVPHKQPLLKQADRRPEPAVARH